MRVLDAARASTGRNSLYTHLSSALGQQGLQGGALLLLLLLLLLRNSMPIVPRIRWRGVLQCLGQVTGLLQGGLAGCMVCQVRGQLLSHAQLLQKLLPLHTSRAQDWAFMEHTAPGQSCPCLHSSQAQQWCCLPDSSAHA